MKYTMSFKYQSRPLQCLQYLKNQIKIDNQQINLWFSVFSIVLQDKLDVINEWRERRSRESLESCIYDIHINLSHYYLKYLDNGNKDNLSLSKIDNGNKDNLSLSKIVEILSSWNYENDHGHFNTCRIWNSN